MSQLRINELLERANILLDKGFHIMPGFVTIRSSAMEGLLDRINASIPEDIKEAEMILKRRDEIIIEAQNRADRIIADAQNEAARILSENEIMRAVHQEGQKIREQVIQDCESIKRKAYEEADNVRIQASEDAMKIKEGAENYAEQVLNNIDTDLTQLQQIVRNGQAYIEKMKQDSYQGVNNQRAVAQNAQEAEYVEEYVES